ncbi:hypothetical protein ACSFBF_05930 [Variovorax sp. ZT5P49]|uniref:hypothetical protein n=1 Tax=Variovorax sp. ZT5P49 TaxID=3443733 RepID=UPI003F44585A
MAILVNTDNSAALLTAIRKFIDDKLVVTWSYDADGDFTHDVDQWRNKAWLRPTVEKNRLVFGILTPKDADLTHVLYGVYHGRFMEMLLTHHTALFVECSATADVLAPYDIV